jgi:hypothetical protein
VSNSEHRIEFGISREAKRRLRALSLDLSHRAGKHVSVSSIVSALVEDFLDRADLEVTRTSDPPLAFLPRESKKKT